MSQIRSLYDLPLDQQFLMLSALRESRNAVVTKPPSPFPIGAALETTCGLILCGHKYECLESPYLSYEALANAAAKLKSPSQKIVRLALVYDGNPATIACACIEILAKLSHCPPKSEVYLSDKSLSSVHVTCIWDMLSRFDKERIANNCALSFF